ncbi:biosynthetic-type acetolactate synthase large subunit [Alteromonas sediminis]|uniref:Acetolactate synthase n=2 Tax=Alteromonas sediminis TaxID=2259342 RepID=A0A3N5YB02_9ALTE|nr:biosynthetic-type acetolactate synthase large subunit [Alteromonas sediminis]
MQANQEEKTNADVILATLADLGVDTVFGYPGGAVLPLYDALHRQTRIRHVLVRHEQAAVHAAEGYARSTGKVGVCLATSGPGATNTITGLTDALMDSVPILCLTGQVAQPLLGTDAFQEANVVSLMRAATKHNCLLTNADYVASSVSSCFSMAQAGRPGPVALDIPKDIQSAQATEQLAAPIPTAVLQRARTLPPIQVKDIQAAVSLLKRAKKPVIYVGGGVINSGHEAADALRTFARLLRAPVTSTLMGLGAFPANDPLFIGMLGMHGAYEANRALHECDLMLNVGARFDDRVTGNLEGFSPNSKKIHIDIDNSAIGKLVSVDIGIHADAYSALSQLIDSWNASPRSQPPLDTWWETIKGYQSQNCFAYKPNSRRMKPQQAIDRLWRRIASHNPIISTEVGQHQMWAAQFCRFDTPGRWLTSGGLGTMGYGLPAAIGAQTAHPDALVIDIAGEASIQMNIQELATLAQYSLPVKVFIVNNQRMGMVRQWQDMHFEGRRSQSYAEALPDFVALANAYGMLGLRINLEEEFDPVISQMLEHNGPVVIECMVEEDENCFPMMPSGANHNEMILGKTNH